MKKNSKVIFIIISAMAVFTLLLFFWIPSSRHIFNGRGRLYIIGTGPAGPQMATLQALETIKKMDAIIAPKKHAMLFFTYIGRTPVLFDPWEGFFDYKGKRYYLLNKQEMKLF